MLLPVQNKNDKNDDYYIIQIQVPITDNECTYVECNEMTEVGGKRDRRAIVSLDEWDLQIGNG